MCTAAGVNPGEAKDSGLPQMWALRLLEPLNLHSPETRSDEKERMTWASAVI